MSDTPTNTSVETIPFGPVLLGQTEKTLQALLRNTLAETGLTEPQWVGLRLAVMLDGQVDASGLIAAITDRAKFADASAIVDLLTERGLVVDGRPTDAGRELVARLLAARDRTNGSVWRDLPADDVEAATRVLNEVLRRARELAA
jgi:DNA-binding MarR family transcriptional regulator